MVTSLISIIGHDNPWPRTLPQDLQTLDLSARIRVDPLALDAVSTDFGRLTRAPAPSAVLHPSSPSDIAALVCFSYASRRPFTIAPRGQGHSVRGQALAPRGVVVDMSSMRGGGGDHEARVSVQVSGRYVDVGGEQLWVDVLSETLRFGLAPRSWTDYLYLTVGGTLSNAGISGQAFMHGPQISNVYELDVITGTGESVTCSENNEPDLFFAVLGGLGQFGIITRARIALENAPQMVRWVRLIYTDFAIFTSDQERLISLDRKERFNYVEGSVLLGHNLKNNWRSSFFSREVLERITRLSSQHGVLYCLEGAKYYDHGMASQVDQELESILQELRFLPGLALQNDVAYPHFLNRVRKGELKLRPMGLWDVPHPWLSIFIPRSRIIEFDRGVFKHILKNKGSIGPVLIYPMNKIKWDERTSAVIPDEDIFYSVGLLRSAVNGTEYLEEQNKEILRFCDQLGIGYKQYLPHYTSHGDWMKHFGPKWDMFVQRKRRYDPKLLLSPGQRIFDSYLSPKSLPNFSNSDESDQGDDKSTANFRNSDEWDQGDDHKEQIKSASSR
uniref:cytokinin dehydrogenase n=1 Tax=Ananas comosus var. bracteatus TaxID=296719 RepID=A0A6V7P127_ANACO|nr:unnamed protein product [Ananas comosus var. bracteatus]